MIGISVMAAVVAGGTVAHPLPADRAGHRDRASDAYFPVSPSNGAVRQLKRTEHESEEMNTAFIALVLATAATRAAPTTSVDALCDPLATFAHDKANVPEIFADTSDPEADKNPHWLRIKNKDELDRLANESGLYTQAFVWRLGSGTFVSIFFMSPSGDWGEYVDHCFRGDGSLARSEATLNTFNAYREDSDAPVSRIRTRYFDSAGRQFRLRTSLVDINTGKPLKVSFQDDDETIFRSLKKLPFARLLPAGWLNGR